ncbi:MAG: hypothetical protein Q7S49_00965 [bacterium]|nr:hypothetical protein [bacterium]
MPSIYLIPFYTKWHYTEGFRDLYHNWKNLIFFVLHFFSLEFLFRTWFAPFGRLNEEYRKGLDLEAFLETLVANTLMRMVGFVLKSIVIIIGLFVLLLTTIFGPVALILWAFAPFIILFLFTGGAVNLLL